MSSIIFKELIVFSILNNSIFRMERITGENNLDLELRFEELCKEIEEDKK